MEFNTPPLNALRAFDAIVRTQSISKAAKVLDVTQSAISQQQKLLETYLGVQLFKRNGKQLRLTQAGEIYAKHIINVFDSLRMATKELLHSHFAENILTINTTPALALKVLLPGLTRFEVKNPNIEIQLSFSAKIISYEDIDVGIYSGTAEDWPTRKIIPLMKIATDTIYLAYSPEIEKKEKFIRFKEWITAETQDKSIT
jgi:LysR family glycine cleavage system transcriptional activator